eukprot:CAMPEP_0197538342 /NCGR_PEP_ID=MMETSP1318-20131121/59566_1 /TAXON_ID=552666 /ORGANISM="Partenskyella glossopodia, Strain RCC365" /LENGTH=150 /DNA_ID=CAMNT_0043096735 /DNA_START=96 /DNA_END=545 /DNA_ORIENTATION=+
MLCKGAPEEWRKRLEIDPSQRFGFLNHDEHQPETKDGDQIDCKSELVALMERMQQLHFSKEDVEGVFETVGAVAHLGNIEFKATDKSARNQEQKFMDTIELRDRRCLQVVCRLLGLDEENFEKALLYRKIAVGTESHFTPLKLEDALTIR